MKQTNLTWEEMNDDIECMPQLIILVWKLKMNVAQLIALVEEQKKEIAVLKVLLPTLLSDETDG